MKYSEATGKSPNELMTLLQQKLSNGEWREADELTRIIMLTISHKKESSFVSLDIDNLPTDLLKKIDYLWQRYSNKKFGFIKQKELLNSENYKDFIVKVGWHNGDSWLGYNDLNFSKDTTEGHLPYLGWYFWQREFVGSESSEYYTPPPHSHHAPHYHHDYQIPNMAPPPALQAIAAGGVGSFFLPESLKKEAEKILKKPEVATVGATMSAAVPWVLGIAAVAGAGYLGYLVYREVTKEEREKKEKLDREEKARIEKLEQENKVEKNIETLLALI